MEISIIDKLFTVKNNDDLEILKDIIFGVSGGLLALIGLLAILNQK